MSLKAKLEAVIYAAEEPVTLAQLATLFAAEALEWKAEQAAASAALAAESQVPESLSLISGELDYVGLDAMADVSANDAPSPDPSPDTGNAEPSPEPLPDSDSASSPASITEAIPDAGAEPIPSAEATAEAEQEARRQARLRDREVRAILRQLLGEIIASYVSDGRGIEIREIAGGYRMATKPECHDAVRCFVKSLKPALKLSLPALETLAVIAYKQPVTAPEVNEIRGVDSSGVFGSLLARKLIATAGRKQVIGRPILYKTTREFLLRFGLKDVTELPSMEEFEKLAAIELEEQESSSSDESSASTAKVPGSELSLELDETSAEDPPNELSISSQVTPETSEPAATAVSHEPPAGIPAIPAEPTPAEAAPAPPPNPEQAETETSPHAEEED
jgi:segregation and condensation protein B